MPQYGLEFSEILLYDMHLLDLGLTNIHIWNFPKLQKHL